MQEFSLIDRYFRVRAGKREDVLLGIGDDCALLKVPKNRVLVVTIDTLVSGVHFFADVDPYDLGYRSLAISLSDIAAMGALPSWVTLAITLPKADEIWLQSFSNGFFDLLEKFSLELVGGNTTSGPLCITTELHGFLPENKALKRSGAKVGDLIYVSGTLGDAGLALKVLKKEVDNLSLAQRQHLLRKFNRPEPRVFEGQALLDIASSAIDISDGLVLDLSHILEASQVGASIFVEDLPLSFVLQKEIAREMAYELALSSGDDYELCFTIPPERNEDFLKLCSRFECGFKLIGVVEKERGLQVKYHDNRIFPLARLGYEHRWS